MAPVMAARVGRMSMVMRGSVQVVPAGMCPGQRMMQGTRVPPSKLVPFPSRSGEAEPL